MVQVTALFKTILPMFKKVKHKHVKKQKDTKKTHMKTKICKIYWMELRPDQILQKKK